MMTATEPTKLPLWNDQCCIDAMPSHALDLHRAFSVDYSTGEPGERPRICDGCGWRTPYDTDAMTAHASAHGIAASMPVPDSLVRTYTAQFASRWGWTCAGGKVHSTLIPPSLHARG